MFWYQPRHDTLYEGRLKSSWTPYNSESELCGGAVTVSFSKYLPWQAMHFLQRSTCCRPLITLKFLASELPFYGWESPEIAWGRDLDCMADVLMRFHRYTFSKLNAMWLGKHITQMRFSTQSLKTVEFLWVVWPSVMRSSGPVTLNLLQCCNQASSFIYPHSVIIVFVPLGKPSENWLYHLFSIK
jgi:hypothetical protein